MERPMVVITAESDKADIRQIVGRDWKGGRKSATLFGVSRGGRKALGLMPKGFQGFSAKWHGVCDTDYSAGLDP